MTIALICPTRGRPEQFKRMCESVYSTANNAQIWAGCILEEQHLYRKVIQEMDKKITENLRLDIMHKENMPTVQRWNDLFILSNHEDKNNKLFMLASDDIIFSTPGWDEALLDHYNKLENKIHVYHLQDSRDPDGTPHPIITREYMDAMGYFVPPIFLHWYVDTWTAKIARFNKVFTHLKDYMLIHDKPSDKGEADETHNRIRRMGWLERDAYVNETCQHFLEFEKQRLAKAMQ